MYHSLTGYMVRLRRRRIEKPVASPFQRVSMKAAADASSSGGAANAVHAIAAGQGGLVGRSTRRTDRER